MSDVPSSVTSSRLWAKILGDLDLSHALRNMRRTSEQLAAMVTSSVPDFTDHSVRHMDALWSVADQVLTEEETGRLALGEAFLLGLSFYLHDIGMALACNKDGLDKIRGSFPYQEFLKRTGYNARNSTDWEAQKGLEAKAVAYAVRKLHAAEALQLASSPVPGTDNISRN
jgi:hypothetical protein